MREGRRRRSSRVGRVGSRSLDVTDSSVVMVVVVISGVVSGHVVRGETSRIAARVQSTGGVVRVVTSSVAMAKVLSLNLVSGLGEHGNVTTASVVVMSDARRGKRSI